MPIFSKFHCKPCDYSTDLLFNWGRHVKSSKHCNNVAQTGETDQNPPVKSEQAIEPWKCKKCLKSYQSESGMYRHLKNCKGVDESNKDDMSIMKLKIAELENQLKDKEYQMKIKELENDYIIKIKDIENDYLKKSQNDLKEDKTKLEKDKNFFKDTVTNSNGIIKQTTSSLNTILNKHYSKAKPLKKLKDLSGLLTFDKENKGQPFELIVVFHKRRKTLHKFLGNFVIANYKKANPAEQSMWNGDIARNSYQTKKRSGWHSDKKGVESTEITITPVVQFINNRLIEYVKTHSINHHTKLMNTKVSNDEINDYNRLMETIGEIRTECENGDLEDSVLDYISPYFAYSQPAIDETKLITDGKESYDTDDE